MRQFDRDDEKDVAQINRWLKARGVSPLEWDDLPKHGLIVDGVACGFLCTTDCDTCFLEGFITNEKAEADERNEAINKIVAQLTELARAFGYKKIIAITKETSLITRVVDLGFRPHEVFYLSKKIDTNRSANQKYFV